MLHKQNSARFRARILEHCGAKRRHSARSTLVQLYSTNARALHAALIQTLLHLSNPKYSLAAGDTSGAELSMSFGEVHSSMLHKQNSARFRALILEHCDASRRHFARSILVQFNSTKAPAMHASLMATVPHLSHNSYPAAGATGGAKLSLSFGEVPSSMLHNQNSARFRALILEHCEA